jgi:nucleoside-diphosphate-sugar epimerase
VGTGDNRWPAVHRLDAATLFRLALEKGTAGSRFHGAAEEGIPVRHIAETISESLNVPMRSMSAEEASAHFGWLGGFIGHDTPASSVMTRKALGWAPKHPDLLADMRENGYFP